MNEYRRDLQATSCNFKLIHNILVFVQQYDLQYLWILAWCILMKFIGMKHNWWWNTVIHLKFLELKIKKRIIMGNIAYRGQNNPKTWHTVNHSSDSLQKLCKVKWFIFSYLVHCDWKSFDKSFFLFSFTWSLFTMTIYMRVTKTPSG